MATLRLLEMPDALFHSMERRAGGEGISVQELVVRELTGVESQHALDENALLDEIRKGRAEMAARGIRITDDLLREARQWGRE
jgi:hypothetical protein